MVEKSVSLTPPLFVSVLIPLYSVFYFIYFGVLFEDIPLSPFFFFFRRSVFLKLKGVRMAEKSVSYGLAVFVVVLRFFLFCTAVCFMFF
jgi:hypothetical protein